MVQSKDRDPWVQISSPALFVVCVFLLCVFFFCMQRMFAGMDYLAVTASATDSV